MARPGDPLKELPSIKHKSKYDWPALMDGTPWRLVKGQHFKTSVEGMRANLIGKAKSDDTAMVAFLGTLVEDEPLPNRTIYVQYFPGRKYKQGPPGGRRSRANRE